MQIIGYTTEMKARSTRPGNWKMELERQFQLALEAILCNRLKHLIIGYESRISDVIFCSFPEATFGKIRVLKCITYISISFLYHRTGQMNTWESWCLQWTFAYSFHNNWRVHVHHVCKGWDKSQVLSVLFNILVSMSPLSKCFKFVLDHLHFCQTGVVGMWI